MDYITIKEASEKWGVTVRAITYHVVAGRIEGAVKKGNLWLLPEATEKPVDLRKKSNRIKKS
jgi:translation initiation factor IF-1